jgi:hypothetical protein
VGLGFLVRLRFALRSLAVWCVRAIAPSFIFGWRAFSSVSLCKSIYFCMVVWACLAPRVWVWGFWFGFALHRVALLCGVFVRLHLALFSAGGPFLPSLSVNIFSQRIYFHTTQQSYATQSEAEPEAPNPHTGRETGPKQPQPRTGRGHASESGQRHASRRTRPTDTGTRCPGKGQR